MLHRFHKMHGLGNDFVIFDAREAPVEIDAAQARALADRTTGIGCDQVILLERSGVADVRMRIFNADGGEVEACGNAARCVALLEGGDRTIETAGGTISGSVAGGEAVVDMGLPHFAWEEIPLAYPVDTASVPVAWDGLQDGFAVNVGNPHIIFFVDDADTIDLATLGPQIEQDALFPARINVNVASVHDGAIKLHVWERGVGLTQACGTGACATAVAAISRRLATSPVEVRLPGGTLHIAWERGKSIEMSGPATYVFAGEVDLDALA